MCTVLKYGVWNVTNPPMEGVNALVQGGYNPLTAMILAGRGLTTVNHAQDYLRSDGSMPDPFAMTDMASAAARVALAIDRGEKIAIFGDYDVDGITATCLLTDYLRSLGANCIPYIPGRLEEGYGLNPIAIHQLHSEGVQLIVTVDCGITAISEAALCAQLGIELVITDHHECKQQLPQAVAVVDPHRPDGGYPHKDLSGVGIAFKLASALCGSQEEILHRYADMVCLGTVADVMPLRGENRRFVREGLEAMQTNPRPGIAALMKEGGCNTKELTATSVGYILAPRINAAGRMGQIQVAVELFLTEDPEKATEAAKTLCELNRQRQAVESEIYSQAIEMLPPGTPPEAIVLADESWHQGVVGIVASRMAEEFCCPTFLICLDGEHGKASSRSYAGFNLFSALSTLSPLLESYGGHELAAGFTISRNQIPAFREQICAMAREYYSDDAPRTVLETDCIVKPELLTLSNVSGLSAMEPCGNYCPKPTLVLEQMTIERLGTVGNGRHTRLRLRSGSYAFNGIFFSTTPESASVCQGDLVDVAFYPQINEYRNERTVQLQILDIRPSCKAACLLETCAYRALLTDSLTTDLAQQLLPQRQVLGLVWRYLSGAQTHKEMPICLLRKIVRWSGEELSLGMLLTCLDIFADVQLLELQRYRKHLHIRLLPARQKADLNQSITMQRLIAAIDKQ